MHFDDFKQIMTYDITCILNLLTRVETEILKILRRYLNMKGKTLT